MKSNDPSLPMNLSDWNSANKPSQKMIFKGGFHAQIDFVYNVLPPLLYRDYRERQKYPTMVVSTHTSKSIKMPVFRLTLADGTTITMRYNLYDWKISIDSPTEIEANFLELFKPEEVINSIYCEGFDEEWVFGCYAKNHRQFTLELGSTYNVYVFFFILSHSLGLRQEN